MPEQPRPVTDTTLEDLYREQWFEQLDPDLQALALIHYQDQFDAVPSYLERFQKENKNGRF